jgi:hypothetical protein
VPRISDCLRQSNLDSEIGTEDWGVLKGEYPFQYDSGKKETANPKRGKYPIMRGNYQKNPLIWSK